MISKNLFFKLQKEDLKRRIWTIALSTLVFFLLLTVVLAIRLGNYSTYLTKEEIIRFIVRLIGTQYEIVSVITITGAVICGLSGFFYLHSRKKVDLYHSIPVRREVLFAVSYLNGLLIYLVPYIVNIILCFIILQVNHYMNIEMFVTALSAVGINLLFYCLIYTLVIIAVMLTGNIIISCLGTAVFFLYGPVLMGIKEMYYLDFYNTYVGINAESSIYKFLSPIGSYFDRASRVGAGIYPEAASRISGIFYLSAAGTDYAESLSASILKTVLATVALLAFSVFLYKKRPSEAAGRAMAFPVSKPVIKFLLAIPATLGGGIVFREIAAQGLTGWFIFGLIFTFIISYGIIEIIYNFDIRSVFNHKIHMLICAVVLAGIVCIFQFDLFQYDVYIPDKNKIESMSVYISGLDSRLDYMEQDSQSDDFRYIGDDIYQLKNMKLTDIGTAYALAGLGIEHVKSGVQPEDYYDYEVKYTLKGGRVIYRRYNLTLEESDSLLKDIFASEEFKKGHYPIYKWDAGMLSGVSCYNMLEEKEFSLDENAKKELLEIYREELGKLTLDEVTAGQPVTTIVFRLKEDNPADYYVYPQFSNTIAFLKEHGFDPSVQAGVQDVKSISISNYQSTRDKSNSYHSEYAIEEDYPDATYVEKEEIEAILPNLIESDYCWNYNSILKREDDLEVNLVLRKDEYGNEESHIYYFREGSIPDFVKEDVGYKKE